MKVSVVRMWHEGRKLNDAELKAEPESHGYLEVEPGCAYLRARDDGHHTAIPFLFDPVLRHLRGDAFVLVGHETVPGGNAYDRRAAVLVVQARARFGIAGKRIATVNERAGKIRGWVARAATGRSTGAGRALFNAAAARPGRSHGARQAKDETMRKMADRIQARAIRRCGELLRMVPNGAGRPTEIQEGERPNSRQQAAADAGLSEHQRKTALRVASVPQASFVEQLESANPPTVTALAKQGTASN